jgi:ssDNA-binding replication factor A large subunit
LSGLKISDVRQGQKGLVLTGKVSKVSPPRDIQTRYGPARVATATFEDDSGAISLNLWRAQIELVKAGDLVRVENAFVNMFRDNLELNLGSDGRLTVLSREGRQVPIEQGP